MRVELQVASVKKLRDGLVDPLVRDGKIATIDLCAESTLANRRHFRRDGAALSRRHEE